MLPINISLVILFGMAICPSCYAKCDNYYIIMEKTIDALYYNPINKENTTWTLSTIHSNNKTDKFDMNCVLNFNCQNIEAHVKKHIPTVLRFGDDVTNKPNHERMKTVNAEEIDTKKIDIDTYPSPPDKEEPEIIPTTEENSYENSTLTDKKYDLDLETTKANSSVHDTENRDIDIPEEGIKSNITENSEDNLEKGIKPTDIDPEIQPENTSSTNANDKDMINKDKDINGTNNLNITGTPHKYDAKDSKRLAYKVMAGILGAVSAVGVFTLVKFGAAKVIEHCTQSGVYRLPNP